MCLCNNIQRERGDKRKALPDRHMLERIRQSRHWLAPFPRGVSDSPQAGKGVYFLTRVSRLSRTTSSLSSHRRATKATWRNRSRSKPASNSVSVRRQNEGLECARAVGELRVFPAYGARRVWTMRTVQ